MRVPAIRIASAHCRRGAITPLFAILLPVLLVLCGFAVNLAYMQKVSTELKVATDCAAHAAGRAMSIHQTTDAAIAQATLTAQTNKVAGRIIDVASEEGAGDDYLEITFGQSIRANNGYGRYEFTQIPKAQVDSGAKRATSVAVRARVDLPLVFQVMNYDYFGGHMRSFTARRRSIATQIDRDIALVLDRSGSMLYYKDDAGLTDTLYDLYQTYETVEDPGHYKYGYWQLKWWGWQWKGYWKPDNIQSGWVQDPDDRIWQGPSTTTERLISWTEYQNATEFLYDRTYTDNVIYQLERWVNPGHTLGDSFRNGESSQLTTPMAQYARDWKYNNSQAPRHSRWYFLDLGVTAFLDIIDMTDQEERCSLVTFSDTARLDYALLSDYQPIRDRVASIKPYGGTAIGDGMLEGLDPIINGEAARPFAAKTIVVLTDGENNNGTDPESAVADIIGENMVTIHTVTFSPGADQSSMRTVAEQGYGRHYHADDGDGLVEIFEEIANNLPTILTE